MEDIQYSLFKHAREYMYKSLQHYIPGYVKDPADLHRWKLDPEYLGDYGVTTVRFYRCPFKFQCNCTAGIKVTEGPHCILIVRCGIHNRNSHNSDAPHDINIFLKYSCMCNLILLFC
jgi:hypothetical protein